MDSKQHKEPESGAMTERMDVGTEGFNEFQAILLNKSKERTADQKRKVELLALKFKMEDYLVSEEQDIRQAGDFLKSYLKTLSIRQNRFAAYIGINPSNLSKVIAGERPINYELALIFGSIFSTGAMLWLEIQAKNELKKLMKSGQTKYTRFSLDDLTSD